MTKSVSTSGLSSLAGGGGGGAVTGGGVSSGLATEGRRQGMRGAHSSSVFGQADKTRDAVRDKLRPLFNNVRVRFSLAWGCGISRWLSGTCLYSLFWPGLLE